MRNRAPCFHVSTGQSSPGTLRKLQRGGSRSPQHSTGPKFWCVGAWHSAISNDSYRLESGILDPHLAVCICGPAHAKLQASLIKHLQMLLLAEYDHINVLLWLAPAGLQLF